jgi:hypothetical protein
LLNAAAGLSFMRIIVDLIHQSSFSVLSIFINEYRNTLQWISMKLSRKER